MLRYTYIIVVFFLLSFNMTSKKLKEGTYRAVLTLNEATGLELPFNFEVTYKGKKPIITIRNADEKIYVDEISIQGDSINFKMPVFDTEFRTKLVGNDLEGVWINHYKTENNRIKFKASFGESKRFMFAATQGSHAFEGKWEVSFSPNAKDSSKAIALFHHVEQSDFVTGTFLTETGDYRFLEGMKTGNQLYLSCFDGSHAFLFIAELKGGEKTEGLFYSGLSWKEPWIGQRNETFELAKANEISFVKNENEKIGFSFPDLNHKKISLSDPKFDNKPVIIQIMGSWCPNCMDESRYFAALYDQYNKDGLEIVALAFEKTNDFELAKKQLLRLKTRLQIHYDILITQASGKAKAAELFPALNTITAFPTTIFLNKNHEVVKVHTGFSGPATGSAYENYKKETESFILNLLKS